MSVIPSEHLPTVMAALRASYHRILDRVEHMLPAKLRPMYNHPAGKAEFKHPAPDEQVGCVCDVLADGCGAPCSCVVAVM